MKKLISVLCILCMAALVGACGDETTEVIGYPDGTQVVKELGYDLTVCVTNDDCGERQLCTVDMEVTEVAGFTVMICVTACDAEMMTVEMENEDGTSSSSTTKVPDTDTCQRYDNMDLFCDMSKHVCEEYTTAEPEPTPAECSVDADCAYMDSDVGAYCSTFGSRIAQRGLCDLGGECVAIEVLVEECLYGCADGVCLPEPTPEPTDDGLRYVQYCYSGGSFVGLFGQIAWSESTPYDPDAWKPGRDLAITDGCFGTTVIWDLVLAENGYKMFYADMTVGVHTGNAAVDAALHWLSMDWYPDTCSVDGHLGILGDYIQDKGHSCTVPE